MGDMGKIETLSRRQTNFEGRVEHQGGLGKADFVIERIALPAKTASVRCSDHANVSRRHFQNFGQCAMEIVRSLRAGPDGQLSIGILDGHRSVLLDGKMGVSLKEKSVLEKFICLGKAFLHVSKL